MVRILRDAHRATLEDCDIADYGNNSPTEGKPPRSLGFGVHAGANTDNGSLHKALYLFLKCHRAPETVRMDAD